MPPFGVLLLYQRFCFDLFFFLESSVRSGLELTSISRKLINLLELALFICKVSVKSCSVTNIQEVFGSKVMKVSNQMNGRILIHMYIKTNGRSFYMDVSCNKNFPLIRICL